MTSAVAETLYMQIGSRAMVILGAQRFTGSESSLAFTVGRNPKNVRWIHIELDPEGYCVVTGARIERKCMQLERCENVCGEDLVKTIEQITGIAT